MNQTEITFWMTALSTACWGLCFWWMHRISSRQNALLEKLQAQSKRIEELSQIEHDLIQDVHPQVGQIKENVEQVAEAIEQNGGVSKFRK